MTKRMLCFFAAAVLGAVLLAGCGGAAPPPQSAVSSVPPDILSVPAPPPSRPQSLPQSATQPAQPPPQDSLYWKTATLPEEPYTPAAQADIQAQDASWFHFLDPAGFEFEGYGENPQPVLMVRFEQYEGSIQLALGVFETGGGAHYIGTYTWLGDGLLRAHIGAWVEQYEDAPAPQAPRFDVELRVEWPEEEGMAVMTLTEIGPGADEAFEAQFGGYAGQPLAYARL